MLRRRTVLKGIAASAAGSVLARPFPSPAIAADTPLTIGCSMPLTGAGFAAVGKLLTGGLKVYQQQHGDSVAGRKIQIVIRDDAGAADNARRIVQEMI
ncbi:MAG: ABC transporter substrate-binding protein, partial [Xanthobacteraceae bacterium]